MLLEKNEIKTRINSRNRNNDGTIMTSQKIKSNTQGITIQSRNFTIYPLTSKHDGLRAWYVVEQ